MTDKQRAHDLLDRLPPVQFEAVVHLLESIVSHDDEPLTENDRQALAEADTWLKSHRPIPHAEVLAEFGLTMADWEMMADELKQQVLPCEHSVRRGGHRATSAAPLSKAYLPLLNLFSASSQLTTFHHAEIYSGRRF
jgi:hypothetical protein